MWVLRTWNSQETCETSYSWDRIQVDNLYTYVCMVNGEKDPESLKSNVKVVFDDSAAVKLTYIYYSRLFEGLQWLWGMADSDGKDHHFGTYKKAKKH